MSTIALFGASGRSGQHVLAQALAAGYAVRALARTPAKITQSHPQLSVLQGDVLDHEAVAACVAGADLVISVFGQVKGSPPDVQTRGTVNIVNAMHDHGVPRIISLSGGGLPYPEKDQPKIPDLLIRGIMRLLVPQVLKDAQGHYEVLKNSGLDWCIARAPRLTDGPRRGAYRVGWVGVDASTQISRVDLADFLLRLAEDRRYDGQLPFVSY